MHINMESLKTALREQTVVTARTENDLVNLGIQVIECLRMGQPESVLKWTDAQGNVNQRCAVRVAEDLDIMNYAAFLCGAPPIPVMRTHKVRVSRLVRQERDIFIEAADDASVIEKAGDAADLIAVDAPGWRLRRLDNESVECFEIQDVTHEGVPESRPFNVQVGGLFERIAHIRVVARDENEARQQVQVRINETRPDSLAEVLEWEDVGLVDEEVLADLCEPIEVMNCWPTE